MQKNLSKEEFEKRRQELLNNPDIKNYPNLFHLLNYPYKNPQFFDYADESFRRSVLGRTGPFIRSIDKIKVPTYVVGKCGHEAGGYWDVYTGLKCLKKLWVKPSGAEERPWREDLMLILRWHDHWLKGIDTGIMEEPQVKLYVTGKEAYRYEKDWPVPNIDYTKLYLRRWEGLSFEPEFYQPEPDAYLQQPLHVSAKRDW